MDALLITEQAGAITFRARVTPRAKRNEIVGVMEGMLRVKLAAPPVEGAANEALIAFIAERLGVRAAQVGILSGETARVKTVRVAGVAAAEACRRLER